MSPALPALVVDRRIAGRVTGADGLPAAKVGRRVRQNPRLEPVT